MTGIRVVTKRHRQALCLAMAVVCAGCAREPDPAQRYVPAPDVARSAIDAVLTDWQAGKAPGLIDRLAVKVQVSDNLRKSGQRLEEFEILGEVPANGVRCFAVRLKFSDPEADERARYVVLGIDPLWVFRQEDYDMLSHWEHPMPPEASDEGGTEAGRALSKSDDRDREDPGAASPGREVNSAEMDTDDEGTTPALTEKEGSPHE